MAFSLDDYFARIHYCGTPHPDFVTLQALHRNHIAAIAFENLDVLLGREIALDDDAIFEKLVTAGRGGYCFEQNALFSRVLREIGFHTQELAARVLVANPKEMPPRTHRLVLVELDEGRWIADVGFGGLTLNQPLPLKAGAEQASAQGLFRLEQQQGEYLLQIRQHQAWQPLYRFDLERQYPGDYLMANHFIAHWPDSHFRHHLLAALHPLNSGRLTLVNLRETRHEAAEQPLQLTNNDQLYQRLQQDFNLRFDHPHHGISRKDFDSMMRSLLQATGEA